jgi:cell division protein FtsL
MKRALQVLAGCVIAALAIGLYKAKTDAAAARAHVRQLQADIDTAQADLRALRAEIAHLESPARVENLAERHLGLKTGAEMSALPEAAIARELPEPAAAP